MVNPCESGAFQLQLILIQIVTKCAAKCVILEELKLKGHWNKSDLIPTCSGMSYWWFFFLSVFAQRSFGFFVITSCMQKV